MGHPFLNGSKIRKKQGITNIPIPTTAIAQQHHYLLINIFSCGPK